jgi:membrane fusion protein, multidrug efflux system
MAPMFHTFKRAAVVAILIAAFGCYTDKGAENDPHPSDDPIQVEVAVIESREVSLNHKTAGEVVSANSLVLKALTNSRIDKVLVHEGQRVTPGTVVINYDNELAKLQLDLARTEDEEASAAIDYDQARFDNKEQLIENEEMTSLLADILEKKLAFEKARMKRAKAAIPFLETVVKQNEMLSPFAGEVTKSNVVDGMPVVEGQILMEIMQRDPMRVRVPLPEELIPSTYKGQSILVSFPTLDRKSETLDIVDVGAEVDALTGTFDVWTQLDNPSGDLKAGMEVEVTLLSDKKIRKLLVPQSAVALRDKKTVIFRVEGDRAHVTRVVLGRPIGEDVEVRKGLDAGQLIITSPPKGLKNKARVEIIASHTAGT